MLVYCRARRTDQDGYQHTIGGRGGDDRGGETPAAADPEVSDRPVRRRFSAGYKRRILREADRCSRGELAALLRREGLYSSHLSSWRKERDRGLIPKKRGPKSQRDPVVDENKRLRCENERLQRRLQQAETIIEVQKKVSALLGIPLKSQDSDDSVS